MTVSTTLLNLHNSIQVLTLFSHPPRKTSQFVRYRRWFQFFCKQPIFLAVEFRSGPSKFSKKTVSEELM